MRSATAAALLLVASCGFQHGALGSAGGDDGGVSDGMMSDGTGDSFIAPDAQQCWSVSGVSVTVCLTAPLSGTHEVMSSTTVDTDPAVGGQPCAALANGSTNVCAIAASTIQIDATRTLSVQGPRPLVLIADTIQIDGTIDVASHVRGRQGPASDLAGCNNGTDADPTRAGGGQGGSFGGKGGDGGNQDGQSNSRGTAGNALTNVTTLRGGCPGGHGGQTSFSLGHGGGAILFVAQSIMISSTGKINASGGSAEKGVAGKEGGGGGGSGGMIVIATPTFMLDAAGAIFANGGHGGGGSSSGTDGADGVDSNGPSSGGSGGAGGGSAGDGASGYPSSSRNGGSGTNNNDGGGGAGGGAGIIRFFGTTAPTGSNISPPAS